MPWLEGKLHVCQRPLKGVTRDDHGRRWQCPDTNCKKTWRCAVNFFGFVTWTEVK